MANRAAAPAGEMRRMRHMMEERLRGVRTMERGEENV